MPPCSSCSSCGCAQNLTAIVSWRMLMAMQDTFQWQRHQQRRQEAACGNQMALRQSSMKQSRSRMAVGNDIAAHPTQRLRHAASRWRTTT